VAIGRYSLENIQSPFSQRQVSKPSRKHQGRQKVLNKEVMLFFERFKDLFSAGGEEVVGKVLGEHNGLFGWACNLTFDEI